MKKTFQKIILAFKFSTACRAALEKAIEYSLTKLTTCIEQIQFSEARYLG